MKGKKLIDYVEQYLAPTLRSKDKVVMDKLQAHKEAGVREEIEESGA